MLPPIVTGSLSFLITLIAIPAIIRVADQKGLYDMPDARKLHAKAIASLGGVGIFMGFLLSMLLTVSGAAHPEFQYYFAAATLIFFLGIKDDILILSAKKKFMVQLAAVAILVHLGGLRIDSMHGLLGITELPQAASLVLTYATMIVVINAFNLIDGVDGLAASLGLLTMTVFGAYFLYIGVMAYGLIAFAMAGSLAAFLYFNFNPAKIFMGDSGSLLLGLVNAILVIKFIQIAGNGTEVFPVSGTVALAVAILMVPLADTLRVFSIRLYQGRSPFSPDRNHIHHLLLDRGLNHKQVTITCLLLNITFIAVAYYGRSLGSAVVLLYMGSLSILFLSLLTFVKKTVPQVVVASGKTTTYLKGADPVLILPKTTPKVISINQEVVMSEN